MQRRPQGANELQNDQQETDQQETTSEAASPERNVIQKATPVNKLQADKRASINN